MKKLLTSALVFIALSSFGQQKPLVAIGAGVANLGGSYGPAMQSAFYAPINTYLYYGFSGGFATAHNKMVSKTEAGFYLHYSELFANVNVMAAKDFSRKFLVFADIGGGIRYSYNTAVLVNGNGDLTLSDNENTGAGFVAGAGFYGFVGKNMAIGLKYSHDFYMEGHDSVLLKCMFRLK